MALHPDCATLSAAKNVVVDDSEEWLEEKKSNDDDADDWVGVVQLSIPLASKIIKGLE